MAAPPPRPAARRAASSTRHLAGLRRAEARARARPRRRADRRRSRRTRRTSSGCSTTCSSPPTAARACPPCSWRSAPTACGRCSRRRRAGRRAAQPSSSAYAAGLESRRNSEQRSHSSVSPIARAAEGEQGEAAQEAAVGLVLPRHRAVALPAVAAQHVEAAVVADAGVGVDGDVVGSPSRASRPGRPRRPATPGVRRTTSRAASRRRARRRPGSTGRWVGGGPAIRSTWVMGSIVHGHGVDYHRDLRSALADDRRDRHATRRTRGRPCSRCASASS